jgi:CBS domain-containing protein
MKAIDVMTKDVVTIRPEASVHDVARLLLDSAISAVPVVDAKGQVLGMVSEGDLIHRHETGTERRRPWWLRALVDNVTLAEEYAKAHGRQVRDVMACPVVTVAPSTELREVATLMDTHRVKRLPVVENGRLIGIVSRADLLRVFASRQETEGGGDADQGIRAILLDRLKDEPWTALGEQNIRVVDGVVQFRGVIGSEEERRALHAAAEGIPGVQGIEDHTRLMSLGPRGV